MRVTEQQRRQLLVYAQAITGCLSDSEDIVHDAYELALRRYPKRTSMRLAVKQCAGLFLAARARGWGCIAEPDQLADAGAAAPVQIVEMREAFASVRVLDLVTIIEGDGERRRTPEFRRARRRVQREVGVA